MYQSTRDKIIDYLFDPTSIDKKIIQKMLRTDPYARAIFEEEQRNIRIEAYLNGELSVPEKAVFERELKENPELAEEFELRKKANIAIGQNELISALNTAYDDIDLPEEVEEGSVIEISSKKPVVRKIGFQYKMMHWIAAACVVALLASGTVVFIVSHNGSVESRLYSQYYQPLNSISSEFLVNSSALNKAKQKYANGDYSDALVAFENLPAKIDIQLEKQFFIGLSQMQLGNYQKAIQEFNFVKSDRETNEFAPLAYWYLGLCHLKAGQKNEAIETFTWLQKNSNYKKRQVDKILRKLK